jgi:hypothetical protein
MIRSQNSWLVLDGGLGSRSFIGVCNELVDPGYVIFSGRTVIRVRHAHQSGRLPITLSLCAHGLVT